MSDTKKTVKISLRIPKQLNDYLETIEMLYGMSKSEVVRSALFDYIRIFENKNKKLFSILEKYKKNLLLP